MVLIHDEETDDEGVVTAREGEGMSVVVAETNRACLEQI